MRTKILSVLFFAQLSASLFAQEWPKTYALPPGEIAIARQTDVLQRYLTPNFRIEAVNELPPNLLAQFVRTAESVTGVLKALPLPLYAPPPEGKPLISIFDSEENYLKAGGAPGTAGYYSGRQARVLIQWEHLNPSSGSLIPKTDLDLLVHELTHLGMHRYLHACPPWFAEGIAEYLAAAHQGKGQFDFIKLDQSIRAHLLKRSSPGEHPIKALSLTMLLQMTPRDWQELTARNEPFETLQAYKASLLLIHYYFHGGEQRRADVDAYLTDLSQLTRRSKTLPILVEVNQAAAIQQKIKAYWSNKGVTLVFK